MAMASTVSQITLVLCFFFVSETNSFSPLTASPGLPKPGTCFTARKSSSSSTKVLPILCAASIQDAATELPDSLEDAAVRAAEASSKFAEQSGLCARCRVDFDTSVGDETFTLLKTSTEFMQQFTSALSYALVPGLQQRRQDEISRVAEARVELKSLEAQAKWNGEPVSEDREDELVRIISTNGRLDENWEGPIVRVYFPDEGNAALARRDWAGKVPTCVEFSALSGVLYHSVAKDAVILFFCPKASESEFVEQILQKTEQESSNLLLSVFVNPNLVDMGVTGFGMAGRLLRERLLDRLQSTYYLRTLAWGALTRQWPCQFSVWQEDEAAVGGYRLIKMLDRLPSNPEVEDIYDIENGYKDEQQTPSILDQFGDFVNGMMRL